MPSVPTVSVHRRAPRQRPAPDRRRGPPRARSSRSTSGTTSARSTRSPGKTGFAHLFEHVMFQGSRHVAKAEHIALVQAAGGTMNGTHLARPDELLRDAAVAPARARAVARGGPDGDAPRRAQPGEPRQPARGRQEREALVVRQPAVRLVAREAPGPPLPAGASRTTTRRSARWRTSTRPRSRTSAPSSGPTTRRTTRSCRSSATSTRTTSGAAAERYFGGIPANPDIPPLGDLSLPPTLGGERRETVHDRVPLPRVYVGFRAPAFGDPRLDALDIAGQILAGGKGSRLHRRLVRDERIAQDVALVHARASSAARRSCAGWATVRPGVAGRARRGGLPRGARAARPRAGQRRRAGPREGPDRDRGARRAASGSRSGPTGSRCTRRCSTTRT